MNDHERPSTRWRAERALARQRRPQPHVLVLEDDADMRRLVSEALERDGLAVHHAADGRDFVTELSRLAPGLSPAVDLLVSDIRMPVANGLQVVAALRSANCWTPVILMTAFGDESMRTEAERLGAILFDKPFELDDLRTAVLDLLELDL